MSDVEVMSDPISGETMTNDIASTASPFPDPDLTSPELSPPEKPVEEQKVQDEPSSLPTLPTILPLPDEEAKVAEEADTGSTAPAPSSNVVYNDSSDSEDGDDPATLPAPTSSSPTSSRPPRPSNPYLHLEEEIDEEDKRDRQYTVPSLSSISFDTPPSSTPATPTTSTSSTSSLPPSSSASLPLSSDPASHPTPAQPATPGEAAEPFHVDPTLILIPDTDVFSRSSLPLLYGKLRLTLSSPATPLPTRLTALAVALDLTRDPLHLPPLIAEGVIDELLLNASGPAEDVRCLASAALLHVVRRREGREYTTANGLIARLPNLLIDQAVDVRVNGCGLLEAVAAVHPAVLFEAPTSAAAGESASVMTFLIRRLQVDGDERVHVALLRCIRLGLRRREGLIVARYNGLTKGVREAIDRAGTAAGPEVLQAMADVLAGIAGEDEGKEEMVAEELHRPLLQWTQAEQVGLRLAATTALTHAAVGVAMKHAVVREGGVEVCVERLVRGERDVGVQCQLLQLLVNLMETAKAKALLVGNVELQLRVQVWADSKKKEDAALTRSARAVMLKYKQWQS